MQQGEMKMSDLNDLTKGCPYGKAIKKGIEDGGNTGVEARLTALETKLAAVLAAKDTDDGKTLQIDSTGKVALVTVV